MICIFKLIFINFIKFSSLKISKMHIKSTSSIFKLIFKIAAKKSLIFFDHILEWQLCEMKEGCQYVGLHTDFPIFKQKMMKRLWGGVFLVWEKCEDIYSLNAVHGAPSAFWKEFKWLEEKIFIQLIGTLICRFF